MGVDFDLASALTLRADLFGDDPALIQGDMVISWAELEDQSARLAGFLAAHGVGPGDRVAIGTTNRPEYLITLLAAVKLRAVAVNVNFRYRAGELGQVLAASRSVVLVHDSALAAAVPAGRAAAPLIRLVLSAERESAALADSTEFAEALQTAPRPRPAPDPGAQWLLFTGGTTGLPKAVVQPQRRVVRDLTGLGFGLLGAEAPEEPGEAVRVLRERHAGRPVVLTGPPLMHATGLYFTLGGLLAGGAAVLLAGRWFDPAELLAAVGRHRVTDVVMVGDAFALPIADELDRAAAVGRRYHLSSLRAMRSVGAGWSPAVKRRLLAHADITLSDTLSATEGGPFALSVSDRRTPDAELGAFRLAPGARLLPVDAAGYVPGEAVGVLAAPARLESITRTTPSARHRPSGKSTGCCIPCRATWPRSTPTAPCGCSAGEAGSSIPAVRRCTPARWRKRCADTPVSTTRSSSGCPIRAGAAPSPPLSRPPGPRPIPASSGRMWPPSWPTTRNHDRSPSSRSCAGRRPARRTLGGPAT